MNLGRGFSVPQEKGVVIQNGDVWIPATPEKPVVHRPNHCPVGMQPNQMGAGNWEDLLGIYSGVLKDETCSGLPPKCNPNSHVGLNRGEPTIRDFAPVATHNRVAPQNFKPTGSVGLNCREHNVGDVAFVETSNRLPQSSNPTGLVGMNHREHNIQDVIPVEKFRRFNQNDRYVSSYLQNLGDVVPPQKVNSLTELMEMKRSLNGPPTNGDRIAHVVDKPSGPHSQVERHWKTYKPDSMMLLQNHILHTNQDIGGYNLQQIPNSRLSVPYRPSYNLNLPPRSEAGEFSRAARPFQLGPVTPDQQKQLKHNQIIQVPHLCIDKISTQENDKQDNIVLPQPPENLERVHNDFLRDTLGTSSAAISTTPKEKQNSDGRNGEIDLNKTPPQKTPKRRKLRPKVVVEGKPKRTPKPAATKNKTPDGNPTTKRKYVRKKGIETSTNQFTDAANEAEVSKVDSEAKSCKRALNFDLENGVEKKIKGRGFDYQENNTEGSKVSFNLNLDSHNVEWFTESNGQSTSAVKEVHQNIYGKEKQTENLYNFIQSVNKIPPQESLPLAATAPPTSKDHTLNIIARSLNVRNANINQSGGQGKYGQVRHHIGGGLAQLVIQANTSEQNIDGKRQPKLQTRPQLLEDLVVVNQKQGSKGEYSHTELTQPLMGSQMWSHGVSESGLYNRESSKLWQNGSESSKAKKVEDKINGNSASMPFGNKAAEDCSEQIERTGNKTFHQQSNGLHLNGGLPHFVSEGKSTSINPTNETNKVTCSWYMNSTDSEHKFQKQVNLSAENIAHMASHHLVKAHTTSMLTEVANCHLVSASQRDPKVTQGNEITVSPVRVSVKRHTAGQTSSNKMSSMDKVQQTKNLQGYGHYSKKVTGSREDKRNIFCVDDITDRMKDLHLDNNGKEIVGEKHSAIVPYRGDGAVVPYEAFDPIKKRRPRPKVDLDPETNRLWNLLMGKEGSETADTRDHDKQKWWEEERKVFHGRVDSFIARMHLVQGDRRFSKWKGSVVDSVIGVFLTQNVSDHLSSSAFMSLAAKFPIKSTTISESCCQNTGNPSIEHEVLVRYPDGTTSYDHRAIKEPVYDHSSMKPSELSEYGQENVNLGRTILINNHTRRTEEGMVSSQSSSESIIFQASEDIRSRSGSNSEAEDQITGSNFRENCDPLNLFKQAARIAAFQQYQLQEMGRSVPDKRTSIGQQQSENLVYKQNPKVTRGRNVYSDPFTNNVLHYQRHVPPSTSPWQKMPMGLEKWEADCLAFLGKESTSSLASTIFEITNGTGIEHARDKAGQSAESSLTAQQTGTPKFLPSTVNHEILNKHLEQQTDLPARSQSTTDQHFINYRQGGMQETFQQESTFLTDPIKYAEAFSKKPSDIRNHSENITLEPTQMKKLHSSDVTLSKIGTTSNARKQKAEKEKPEPFNWDTLRKQVQSKAGTRGRSGDTMDSLDYEALRNADVREISDTIKERGMNNMLAERIKDFLNRLVRDHEAIDLEWLRDVQPDKAKDYLLSVRGLGLKSVECVRLLTLHHLAFPVDTNVGRIAVRLGWVPLQPLPESLQLHLLELYPVLESIQKYLWPRLCMLDQETLYELHYQMITFGKVFCTKREPNCNACPMRGECRHFASAFASARLVLPGPEDRRIVSSAAPSSSKSSGVSIKPMPLPPAEDNLGRGMGFTSNCEPIIEEPTTPESPIEVSERDIEDAFYEDPDEIPVIKLNIEEFTTNLQSFIQEKMEMQEGDMSKALVALSPELASIPMPKLKHISRLRTEHQVYELPDSHPLLKGLDGREPDDPSPYLLALWTPGETADSVQPPESKCSYLEGGLCNTKTCFSCNSTREAQAQTVRGTILIPCRTAMKGSFPLNGTYFQVNEVFADHETSMNPIDVPRSLIWNLPRRTVFFGTSVSTIFKGLSTEGIQYCFWKGFVCVRGFDQKTRAPRPLKARLHLPASKIAKQNEHKQSNVAGQVANSS